jgi:hypothetical protein
MALDMYCSTHEWSWSAGDVSGCPVCLGITLEKARRSDYLARIQTWNPDKVQIYFEGWEAATDLIIKELEAKDSVCLYYAIEVINKLKEKND